MKAGVDFGGPHADLPPGTTVRVREDFPTGHIRTPVYVRGRHGVVTRRFGRFANPEQLGQRLPADLRTLYEVRFRQMDLWPGYTGPAEDTLDIDLYEHWLEPV